MVSMNSTPARMVRITAALCLLATVLPFVLGQGSNGARSKSILLRGGTIIAYDDQKNDLQIIRGGSLLITDDRIVDISQNNIRAPPGTEVIDATGRIITPGFVDTHKHGWQHLYQTMMPDVMLGEYFYKYSALSKVTTQIDVQDVYISTLMSMLDSLNGGVTSVLDHGHATFTQEHDSGILKGIIESGARVWHGYSVQPVVSRQKTPITMDYSGLEQNGWRWKQLEQLASQAPWENGRVQLGLAWEFGDNADGKYGFDLAEKLNLSVVTMHDVGYPVQPSGYGSKAIYQLSEWGALNNSYPVVFSHGTLADGADLALLKKYNHFISITPESEHHYAHGQLFAAGIMEQAALGIDTSNTFSSDILTQMRLQLQSTRSTLANPAHYNHKFANNTAMTAKQAFLLGTRNGGLALRRPDIGVIKRGAKADLVVFSSNNTAFSAFYDPVAAVVLHSNAGDIEHVLVDGRFVKRNFHLQGYNWADIQAKFRKTARKIQKVLLEYEKNWGAIRSEAFTAIGMTDEMFENITTVNVEPSVLKKN